MTITLEAIKAEHAKVAELIATFEAQAKAKADAAYPITVAFPSLNPRELYIGAIISANGTERHHVILLPGEIEDADWKKSMDWATGIGGDLPDRIEQALLLAIMKDQFKEAAYWSNTQHAALSGYVWVQNFYNGSQNYDYKSARLRARAVRRVPI